MKRIIVTLLLSLPIFTSAQKTDRQQAVELMENLVASWTLGVDSNSGTVNIAMFNAYKDLFAEDARIDDDLNIRFLPGKSTGSYKLLSVPKDFDEYAHDVALEVNNLRIDSLGRLEMIPGDDSFVFEIERRVYIEKPARFILRDVNALADTIVSIHPDIIFEKKSDKNQNELRANLRNGLREKIEEHPDSVYKFQNTSIFRVTIKKIQGINANRITEIRSLSNNIKCINDKDLDGVLDAVDASPDKAGDFSANGAPDADLDGISDSADFCRYAYGTLRNQGCPDSYFRTGKQWDGSLGLQSNNANIGLPELNELGYKDASGAESTDVLQSNAGSLKSSAPSLGVYAAGNFTLFFGKNARQSGISVGLAFTRFATTYEMEEPIVYTYKANDGSDDYRRQISVSSLTEKMSYSVFNFPVQLNYRMKMGAKKNWVTQFRAGPSLLFLQATTDYNTTIDIGGIYQIDTAGGDRIAYYDYFDNQSTWNVYLTASGINKQSTANSAAAVFDGLQRAGGYDFAAGKVYRDQEKVSRLSYAFNFSWDAQYKKSQESPLSLKAGVHITYAPSTGSKDKYKMIDRTTDEYNSIFNSNGRSYYFAYGFNIGLVYDF